MHLVGKALWFIESRLRTEIGLDAIATNAGVSRFHLCRAFGSVTGRSVMAYVRARRLSEAARALAGGAPDILCLALDAGYGSHEAFTRAFRAEFGVTPEAVRAARPSLDIALVEPILMPEDLLVPLEAPRLQQARSMIVAGLSARYSFDTNRGIPAQWQAFIPYIPDIPEKVGWTAYGVCRRAGEEGEFDYLAGVEVARPVDLAPDLSLMRIEPRRYAVFTHRGHVSGIRAMMHTIWNDWLPNSRYVAADAPDFESYGEDFDGATASGTVEIWIPIEDRD